MKKLITIALLTMACMTAKAQTNTVSTNSESLFNWQAKDWVIIPFAGYQIEKKQLGGGVAALYTVTSNFWAGARIQSFGHDFGAAGVQAQIQPNTISALGMKILPFVETSAGIGNNSAYGNVGAGAAITFHEWTFKIGGAACQFSLGAVGDYEHYVFGNVGGNQANLGLLTRFQF